ncbi:hypothetical protein D3H64_08055 [Atopobacter sp. AH10]|uniref:hypothetical protein n=1 Tax=Atopobacter sp. AH10 TaxID=2315861 RepID=UPI000EF25B3C|nr:hypothetical protein [Atopobacter sp. AH10]RLK62739.1 hypothetical protein D3H64_08055 [Atopobacter sp. AH10]
MNAHYDNFEEVSLTTQIVSEKNGYYSFEDTVFYGEKGGQPSDHGSINGLPLVDLKWEGDILYHKVSGQLSNPIHMQVDLNTRWLNTAIQSSFHLLDGFYESKGLKIIAVNANPDNTWYELAVKDLSQDLIDESQNFLRQMIRLDFPVEFTYMKGSDYPDEFYHQFDEVRIVHFKEVNTQPCGTCHVNHTGQIGSYSNLYSENTAKGTRVHIAVNSSCNSLLEQLYLQQKSLSQLLSVSGTDILNAVKKLRQSDKESKKEIQQLKKSLLLQKADRLSKLGQKIIHLQDIDPKELRELSQLMTKKIVGNQILFTEESNSIHFAIISAENRSRDLFGILKEQLDQVTGGGAPHLVSGRAIANVETFQRIAEGLF